MTKKTDSIVAYIRPDFAEFLAASIAGWIVLTLAAAAHA